MTTPSTTALWLVGARGSVATTAAVGALAVGAGLAARTGLVGDAPELAPAGLPDLDRFVLAGSDIGGVALPKRAALLAEDGVIPAHLPAVLADALAEVEARIRPGIAPGHGAAAEQVRRVRDDLVDLQQRTGVERVVVVNVASTEPPVADDPAHASWPALRRALEAGEDVLPPSALYALAAFEAGASFVDFTPSAGARLPAVAQRAEEAGLPWAGSDGKTGETLVKAALAPMFTTRQLRVRSWAGVNLLGGGDGATLADPSAGLSKTRSKSRGLQAALGYPVDAPVHIDNVPDLGEWKTAWDHISFEGFLGTRMTMQFTWQGCDSALAAPLVLDLARLTARAHERGFSGPLGALGFFFKDPAGSGEHRLPQQWDALVAFAADLGAGQLGAGR
jgi:myo-inositol-1-phosphate synthase